MNLNINSQLIQASRKGDLSQVKKIIKNGANVHAWDDASLREAARFGHLEMVKYLVEDHDADVHACDDDALSEAARFGHLEMVKYLVEDHDTNVHARDNALRWAAVEGHLEVVKYLVEDCNADVHALNDYALRYAAENHLEVVKYLKRHDVLQFTKRHIDKQNIRYASQQYKLPFEIQQLISSYV